MNLKTVFGTTALCLLSSVAIADDYTPFVMITAKDAGDKQNTYAMIGVPTKAWGKCTEQVSLMEKDLKEFSKQSSVNKVNTDIVTCKKGFRADEIASAVKDMVGNYDNSDVTEFTDSKGRNVIIVYPQKEEVQENSEIQNPGRGVSLNFK